MDKVASSYRSYLDGDDNAFDEIILELFDPLTFFINRYVHDLNTAEDISMDVFADLIVHPHRYNFKVSLKTYMYMVGRGRALNYIKRHKLIESVDIEDGACIADSDDAFKRVFDSEMKMKLNQAVLKLPVDMQTVVHLIYFEDMTYDESARVMKKTKKQIDNLLYRAKKQLRDILGEEMKLYL